MYTTSGIAIVTLIAAGLVAINLLLHYESFNALSRVLARLAWVGRPRVALLIGALLGLMPITWSASFTFLEIARFWKDR